MTLIESLQTLANYSRPHIGHFAENNNPRNTKYIGQKTLEAIETLATNLGISMDDLNVTEIRRQYEWALEVLGESKTKPTHLRRPPLE